MSSPVDPRERRRVATREVQERKPSERKLRRKPDGSILELWRSLRDFTHDYNSLCSALVGKGVVLGYDPRGEDLGAGERAMRIGATLGAYSVTFGRRAADSPLWNEERLTARAIVHRNSPYHALAERLATFDWQPLITLVELSAYRKVKMYDEIRELARFLLLKAVKRDLDGTILSPPTAIDHLWHLLLQFPVQYQQLCGSLFGPVGCHGGTCIGHNPLQAYGDPGETVSRLSATLAAHVRVFGERPTSPLCDDILYFEEFDQLVADFPSKPADDWGFFVYVDVSFVRLHLLSTKVPHLSATPCPVPAVPPQESTRHPMGAFDEIAQLVQPVDHNEDWREAYYAFALRYPAEDPAASFHSFFARIVAASSAKQERLNQRKPKKRQGHTSSLPNSALDAWRDMVTWAGAMTPLHLATVTNPEAQDRRKLYLSENFSFRLVDVEPEEDTAAHAALWTRLRAEAAAESGDMVLERGKIGVQCAGYRPERVMRWKKRSQTVDSERGVFVAKTQEHKGRGGRGGMDALLGLFIPTSQHIRDLSNCPSPLSPALKLATPERLPLPPRLLSLQKAARPSFPPLAAKYAFAARMDRQSPPQTPPQPPLSPPPPPKDLAQSQRRPSDNRPQTHGTLIYPLASSRGPTTFAGASATPTPSRHTPFRRTSGERLHGGAGAEGFGVGGAGTTGRAPTPDLGPFSDDESLSVDFKNLVDQLDSDLDTFAGAEGGDDARLDNGDEHGRGDERADWDVDDEADAEWGMGGRPDRGKDCGAHDRNAGAEDYGASGNSPDGFDRDKGLWREDHFERYAQTDQNRPDLQGLSDAGLFHIDHAGDEDLLDEPSHRSIRSHPANVQLFDDELDELDIDGEEERSRVAPRASPPNPMPPPLPPSYRPTVPPAEGFSRLEGLTDLELTGLGDVTDDDDLSFDYTVRSRSSRHSAEDEAVRSGGGTASGMERGRDIGAASLRDSRAFARTSSDAQPLDARRSSLGPTDGFHDERERAFDGASKNMSFERKGSESAGEVSRSGSSASDYQRSQRRVRDSDFNPGSSTGSSNTGQRRQLLQPQRPGSGSGGHVDPEVDAMRRSRGGSSHSSRSSPVIPSLPLKQSRDRYATDLADECDPLIEDAVGTSHPHASWRRSSGGAAAPSAEPEAGQTSKGSAASSSSRRDSYGTTPQATPFRSTSVANGADMTLHDMVVEARNECLSLRALNVRLLASNEELRTRLDEVGYEKERADSEFNQELSRRIDGMKRAESERVATLQSRIHQLETDLESFRSSQTQMASIRATLEREKELDILTLKKELLVQKERQLQDLRREMATEKEETSRKLREDMKRQADEASRRIRRLESNLAELEREAAERQEDLQQARRSLAARPRRPETQDVGVQHDAVSPLVRDLRAELRAKDTMLTRLQEELRQLFGGDDLGSSRGSGSGTGPTMDIAGADVFSRLLERCRRHVHSSSDAIRRLRADLEERDYRAATIREDSANAVSHEVSTARRELEAKHRQALDSLRTTHARELATIANAHDATLAALRRDLDAALARPAMSAPSPDTATVESLQALYPSQFAQLAQSNAARIATLEADHAFALDAVRDRAEASVRDAVSRSHREAAHFKEQFTAAYHTAVTRLKDNYLRLAEAKEEAHKREMQDMAELNRREVDEAVREGIEKGRLEAEDAAAAAARRWGGDREEMDRLRERIAELEDALTQTKLAHNQALLDSKHRSAKDLQESLQRMKDKYLETLAAMRDDLARNKSAEKERFEAEWIRRETEIDRRWIARLDSVKPDTDPPQRPRPHSAAAVERPPPAERERRPLSRSANAAERTGTGTAIRAALPAWKPAGAAPSSSNARRVARFGDDLP
ncbi:hypothetical protein BDK51DRAFT_30106 [Blyttiomyces helicus]|uniref:Uncharacterized protein n=1 Tax=Blyttiomyces helicus TaxID=388810 RepID=A0A4P9WIA2_9FUNG|nr:hypothetical protein BDK51DRAFT_30106 [Blyttiomyces helicus]|eukprot:RKO92142.1 hypothetical protein BDK51DRAFT_30106 [Blyttiomyces helicus]